MIEIYKKCRLCGEDFLILEKSRKEFCSKGCFYKAYPFGIKTCEFCNKEFEVKYHQASMKFCSKTCRQKPCIIEKKCLNCDNTFLIKRFDKKKYCSNSCANKYNGRRSRINRGEPPFSRCKQEKTIGDNNLIKSIVIQNKENKTRPSLSKSMKGRTWTLGWFIEKLGKTKGEKAYKERSEKIRKTTYFKVLNKIGKNNYSKISQTLFWGIYNEIKNKYSNIYFQELNHEYGCKTNSNFDFVIDDAKKVIEFHGDKFHANPKLFKETDCPNPFNKKLSSKDIWLYDAEKNQLATKNGYEIFIIWESDYLDNKSYCLNECLNFIEGRKK